MSQRRIDPVEFAQLETQAIAAEALGNSPDTMRYLSQLQAAQFGISLMQAYTLDQAYNTAFSLHLPLAHEVLRQYYLYLAHISQMQFDAERVAQIEADYLTVTRADHTTQTEDQRWDLVRQKFEAIYALPDGALTAAIESRRQAFDTVGYLKPEEVREIPSEALTAIESFLLAYYRLLAEAEREFSLVR